MNKPLGQAICQFVIGMVLIQSVFAQWQLAGKQKPEVGSRPEMSEAVQREVAALTAEFNHNTLAYRAAVFQKVLPEINYFSEQLKLPLSRPIRMTDIDFRSRIGPPWFSIVRKQYPPFEGNFPDTIFTTNIYDPRIPREKRLQAVTISISGVFIVTNFEFCVYQGKIREVMCISGPDVERYSRNLEELVGKPSKISQIEAYEMATQWVAAVGVDMGVLSKMKWTVNQLHYLLRGATNRVDLPLYYVDFNYKGTAPRTALPYWGPVISVEILGTTKELQDLQINDLSLTPHPPLLITNGYDLVHTPNPTFKEPIKRAENVWTNSPPQ